jgi:hypothetical protein
MQYKGEETQSKIVKLFTLVLQQLRLCFSFSQELTPANQWAGQATLGFRLHLASSD